jgi:hypothetical protein
MPAAARLRHVATFALLLVLALARAADGAETPEAPKYEVWGERDADWTAPVEGWTPVQPGEHPRLVFRKGDIPRLKQRAETPAGKAMVERMKALLDDKFTLWHPAGNGLLYLLTGDRQYAEKAKQQVLDVLERKVRDGRDGRYGFYNPGSGGQMRAGPAVGAIGLAYDLNYGAWDEEFRGKVAVAIQENPWTRDIAAAPPIGPGCNLWGAAAGGAGLGLLAIRGDPGVDGKMVEEALVRIAEHARKEIALGYGDRGYYFEGHQCGRISSNTGLFPFIQAYRLAAGRDLVAGKENARWLAAKWIYEFALNPDGSYTNCQRGMYCRNFPRGGACSQQGDFCLGFGVCPPEFVPALKWVYNHQVEPGEKTYDVLEYPHQAIYALANWPLDVQERNPADTLPLVLHDAGAGYLIFRNGWSAEGRDICVSVLLGAHPQNGRGMAAAGTVYIYGEGLGWARQAARCRLPCAFLAGYLTYAKFEEDGSGVISARAHPEYQNRNWVPPKGVDLREVTSLAVDFSRGSGAELLCAIVGPLAGQTVNCWMDLEPARLEDVRAAKERYSTRTVAAQFGGKKGYLMTLCTGYHPRFSQEEEQVVVGGQAIRFDGEKLVLTKTRPRR